MHIGSFDNEPATVALMDTYLEQNGYVNDINKDRLHHEIYMSDARKVAPEKWKTEFSLFYRLFSPLDSEMICIFPYFYPCEESAREIREIFI